MSAPSSASTNSTSRGTDLNTLSILLYLTDVVDSLNNVLGIITFIMSVALLFSLFIFSVRRTHFDEPYDRLDNICLSFAKRLIIGIIVTSSLLVVAPSQRTMLMIVASEYGEKIYNSKSVTGILNPATNLLKSYIEVNKK